MERFISVRIDQTKADSIRLHYDYGHGPGPAPGQGPGQQAAPVDVPLREVQERIDRAETDYYAELPADPEERARRLAALVAYGRELYALIDTPQRLLSAYTERTAGGEWDVLVLGIDVGHDAARFAHLPWELLHDGRTFLVTAPHPVVPVRCVPRPSAARPLAARSLRLVFMACAPDLAPDAESSLDHDAEQGSIWEATRRQGIDLEVEESGDLDELEERIHDHADGAVDVVHLTGHAVHAYDEPKFLTEDRMGRPRQAGLQDLHRCLAGRARVLFLSGCRTGEAADAGAVASLAERLARGTAPVVLGWGRPVADSAATRAAAIFYRWLARGVSPTTALAKTYGEMNTEVPYWHLLRMYLRGDPPGPLVEPARERGGARRPRDAMVAVERTPGKAEPTYPDPLRFVGRRRQVQQAIRMLHPFGDVRDARPGLVVHGMGGIGKTTLVGRVCQRLADQFHLVVLRLGDDYLTEDYLRRVLMADPRLADVLEGAGSAPSFLARLPAAFERYPGNLLFWLDEFESSFRPDERTVTDIAMEGERPIPRPEAVEVLTRLVTALAPTRSGHRVVVTSRYPLRLPCTEDFGTITLAPPRAEEIGRLIDRLTDRLSEDHPAGGLTPERIDTIREAAGDNPRLLENLFRAASQGIDVGDDLLRVRMRETRDRMLDADIALPLLLSKVSPASTRLLQAAAPYHTPVPCGTLARLTQEPADQALEHADRLAGLNLLERTWRDGAPRFVVPLLLRGRLSAQDAVAHRAAAGCATALAAELGDFLDEPDVRRLDEPLLQEVRRLALEGGDSGLAVDATVALAEIHDTYGRYGEVAALCHQILPRAPEHRLYRVLAAAESELGHVSEAIRYFDEALTTYPPETDRERAETLATVVCEFTFHLPNTPDTSRRDMLTEAIELARGHGGIQPVLVFALRTLARVLAMTGDRTQHPTIKALLDEAEGIARTIRDGGGHANAVRFDRVCAVLLDRGDYRAAEGELAVILKVYEQLGQPRNASVVLLDAAHNWLDLGEVEQAEKLADKISALNRTLNYARLDVGHDLLRGSIALHRGAYEDAEQHYAITSHKASALHDEASELSALSGRVQCRRRLGDKKGADRLLQERLLRQEEFRSPTYRVDLLLAAVEQYDVTSESAMDEADKVGEVLEMSREAASLARIQGLAARERRAWESFCAAAEGSGGLVDERESALRRVLELEPDPEARVPRLIQLGRLLLGAERFAAAGQPLAEALAAVAGGWQEAEVRGLLAEAARGNQDHRAAAEQLTALVRLRLQPAEASHQGHTLAVGTLRELAAAHRADHAQHRARTCLLGARSLARQIPHAELEHEILEELADLARESGNGYEEHLWQRAAESAHYRKLPLRVLVTRDVGRFFDSALGGTAIEETDRLRTRFHEEEGWTFPGVRYSYGDELPDRSYAVLVWGDTVHQAPLPTDHVLLPARPPDGRTGRVTSELGVPAVEWLTDEQSAGLPTEDPSRVTLAALRVLAARYRERIEPMEEPPPPPDPGIEELTVQQILDRL
ncbi:CHAT domain-containing protein [Streptomyces aurantiacus]|uniref:Uncharacterized protein n=1 Tax=Streptomyces aurantiacus JA 4570 TaxID=1286094 RepID=S3ZTL1_9ACTN|nr:CHAT domain-containing protein [Streptomyces aurantiacus]EPH46523.1 hypothetical protein STRAU_0495 [Streptomyces aurantiacus JA 4570]